MLSADASDLRRRDTADTPMRRTMRRDRMPSRLSEAAAERGGAAIAVRLPGEDTFCTVNDGPHDVPPHARRNHAGSGRFPSQPDSESIS